MTYSFALIESIVMGSVIALTDILLRPGAESKGGIEEIFLYLAQATILGVVFQVQNESGLFCSAPEKPSSKMGDHKKVLKVISGGALLYVSDAILRPMHVNNLWMQAVKFVIQGGLIYHMYAHDFSASFGK